MYLQEPSLDELAGQVIAEKFPDLDGAVRIKCLRCTQPKKTNGKTVYADCQKLSEKTQALTGLDFVITFYDDAKEITPEAAWILMEHELRHVGWDGEKKSIVPHDVEDFRDIIDAYGIDWLKKRQTSLFDQEG